MEKIIEKLWPILSILRMIITDAAVMYTSAINGAKNPVTSPIRDIPPMITIPTPRHH